MAGAQKRSGAGEGRTASAAAARHVALLRGINVGGKNSLPMRDLVDVFTELGCRDVVTYIQSGNVVFSASDALCKRVPKLATERIAERFSLGVPVVVRSARALADVAASNPFLEARRDEKQLHVAFLADAPSMAEVSSLDPRRSPPDEYVVRGADIYLCLPNGVARSKLTNAYFDSALKTTSTIRNWRTVTTLLDMARSG